MSDFAQAREQQHAWKDREIARAAVALVRAGLRELDAGQDFFGPDNLEAAITFDGQGIVGSAVHMLREAHIIADCWAHRPEDGIVHGRRRSLRPSANGRKVSLYTLTNRGIAEAFLRGHGMLIAVQQSELQLA